MKAHHGHTQVACTFGGAQGHFELNVFKPVAAGAVTKLLHGAFKV